MTEILAEAPVVTSHTYETLKLLSSRGNREIHDSLDFSFYGTNFPTTNNLPQISHRSLSKLAFSKVHCQICSSQMPKHYLKLFYMLGPGGAVDNQIIKISFTICNSLQHFIHQPLKCSWSITHTKRHGSIMTEAIKRHKGINLTSSWSKGDLPVAF